MCRLWQTRIGFGGPWQKGKRTGQMSLFMVFRLYYDDYSQAADDPSDGSILFDSWWWIGY